jgi:hypothetical protein
MLLQLLQDFFSHIFAQETRQKLLQIHNLKPTAGGSVDHSASAQWLLCLGPAEKDDQREENQREVATP